MNISAAKGCLECRNTGHYGRIGMYEIFKRSPAIKKLIKPGTDTTEIHRLACQEGMKPLRLSGAQKVAAALTSIQKIVKITPPSIGD